MKSVLISIQPKWCELIANGKKTVEVRKTRPKLETPFKVYIYCTKAKEYFSIGGGIYAASDELYRTPEGEIKFGDSFELAACEIGQYNETNFLNGKVIGKFVCDAVISRCEMANADIAEQQGCIKREDLLEYAGNKELYGWHISNLIIYDKPEDLSEFYTVCKLNCEYCEMWGSARVNAEEFDMDCKSDWFNHKPLTRPPQSWCYVEKGGGSDA